MPFDVAVIGGGPAGSTVARLLAEWGHSVILLAGPEGRKPTLAESLPPSTRKLFAFLGILDSVDRAEFYRTSGNTVWWGDARGRSERFSGPQTTWGYQVLRSDFDRLLLDLAGLAGARVCFGAVVRHVDLKPGDWSALEYDGADRNRRRAEARFILDCSGRAGVIARNGQRMIPTEARANHRMRALRTRPAPAPSTLALAGIWQRQQGWGLEDETHTLVESYRAGWAWSIPISSTSRYFTVMIDGQDARTARPEGLKSLYRAALDQTTQFKKILSGATPTGGPWGWDASLYSARCFAGDNFLLVGDAASFIDPLSSFGVKKALASAWVAAVVVNTCLTQAAMRELALEFYSNRERQIFASYLRQSQVFGREALAQYDSQFWRERSGSAADATIWEDDEEVLKRDPAVLAAFDALKKAPSICLERAPEARVEKRAGIVGREVSLEEAVTYPGVPTGLRFLGGIQVPKLLEIAGDYSQVPDLFEAYNRRWPPVSLPDFLGVLSVLLAKGILINQVKTLRGPLRL